MRVTGSLCDGTLHGKIGLVSSQAIGYLGQSSYRGADYIVVALYHARLSPTAINRKLDLLTSFLDVCLE